MLKTEAETTGNSQRHTNVEKEGNGVAMGRLPQKKEYASV